MKNINEIISNMPEKPGVYIMKNAKGEILYIGKAINIKNRVKQYFDTSGLLPGSDERPQILSLIKKVENIEFIVCRNETEALILEANLVRNHKPQYNILLKDDKHYPYVKITKASEEFPRILIVRKVDADKDVYFGPFTDTTQLRLVVQSLKRILKIRDCNLNLSGKKAARPCIDFAMKLCDAPCIQNISAKDYGMLIEQAIKFFQGQRREIISFIQKQMNEASENMNFERAAQFRDILFGIRKITGKQSIDFRNPNLNCDVFAVCKQRKQICFTVMNVRNGNLINQNNKIIPGDMWSHDSHAKLIVDYYTTSANAVPKNIVLSQEFAEDENLIRDFMTQKYKARTFIAKNTGYSAKLVSLAKRNCEIYLAQTYQNDNQEILRELADICNLPEIPQTIEAFDISNAGDKFCVAAMVHFNGGEPDKSNYRRFKIKTVIGQNDFAMLTEAITRRLSRLYREKRDFPDLLLIDGGKGQLSSAQKAVNAFFKSISNENITQKNCMIISLAEKNETIISPYTENPEVQLNEDHPVRRLMQRIRDEVHRFAITYHRQIRGRQFNRTILQDIEGIGEKKAEILLKTFGSVNEISQKSAEELAAVKGITEKDAKNILDELSQII